MSDNYLENYVEVTMHKFKTHIAHYIRMMEAGLYRAIVVKRGSKPVGMFMLIRDKKEKG